MTDSKKCSKRVPTSTCFHSRGFKEGRPQGKASLRNALGPLSYWRAAE